MDRLTREVNQVEVISTPAAASLSSLEQERVSSSLNVLKDAVWAVGHDRIGLAESVMALLGERAHGPVANLDGWWSVAVALGALDRLEVRGRDSAGIHVLISGPGVDAGVSAAKIGRRAVTTDGAVGDLFESGALRTPPGALSFVYKAASEIGELGDNVKALRAQICADSLLADADRVGRCPGVGAGAHPLGERGDDLGAQRAPSQLRRGRL